MRKLLALAVLLVASTATGAMGAELRPFTADSLAAIKEQFAGRPFVLALWSTTCTSCLKELRVLGRLAGRDPNLPLAIVSTDTPEDAADIRTALKRAGLDRLDTWVFADGVPERLRHAIDPAWRGELPKSYLYDAAHRREAHAGALDEAMVRQFLQSGGKSK